MAKAALRNERAKIPLRPDAGAMSRDRIRLEQAIVNRKAALILSAALAPALSAPAAAQAPAAGWQASVSVTPYSHRDADLRDGGSFGTRGASLRLGVNAPAGARWRAGVALAIDRIDFDFTDPAAFGGAAPWKAVERTGISVPLVRSLADGWGIGVTPSVDAFRETGADAGKARSWGAVASAVKRYADGDRIGFGIGVFDGLERTRVFPFVLVDLALGDRWRLVNPLPSGPTGPAGLELDYRLDDDWRLGVGAAWRSTRFRLAADGPVPSGIGEERGAPLFLRATRELGAGRSLNVYFGTIVAGRLRVEDERGHELRSVRFDSAPLLGATLAARF
jgi:hypothetical protein